MIILPDVDVCAECLPGTLRGQKVLDLLELEL